MNQPVVVVGDLVTDVLAVLSGPLVTGSDVAARIRLTGGGQAANTAAWLARGGSPVTLVATVGEDAAGSDRVAELSAAGVDCAVRAVPGVPTGTLVVLADAGERTMATDRGAADQLRPADVERALSRRPDAGHVHVSGYALLGEGSRAAGRHALAAARDRGLTTSVDAASTAPLRRAGASFLEWVSGVDLLFANAGEAAALAGASDPAAAAGIVRARTGASVVVKLGPAGALWVGSPPVVRVPAEPAPVADPTGAGDAFAAGLLPAWLRGAGAAAALRSGVHLGAAAVTVPGARPSATG